MLRHRTQPVSELGPPRLDLRDDAAEVDLEVREPAVAVVVGVSAQLLSGVVRLGEDLLGALLGV